MLSEVQLFKRQFNDICIYPVLFYFWFIVFFLLQIVCDRVAYHSERYLLPVGFESTRMYPSMIEPTRRCLYTCRILDGGDTPLVRNYCGLFIH